MAPAGNLQLQVHPYTLITSPTEILLEKTVIDNIKGWKGKILELREDIMIKLSKKHNVPVYACYFKQRGLFGYLLIIIVNNSEFVFRWIAASKKISDFYIDDIDKIIDSFDFKTKEQGCRGRF